MNYNVFIFKVKNWRYKIMKIVRKENIQPINNADGELFYEMLGRGEELGNTMQHSVGHVVVLKGYSTNKHIIL